MVREIILPKLGQTMEEGAIVEWFKQEGDPVERGEVLFTTESDKATLEVEAPGKGILRRILVPAGENVPVLTVVGLITRDANEDIASYGAPPSAQTTQPSVVKPTLELSSTVDGPLSTGEPGRIFASPRARKLARERGVNLTLVVGTGPSGRIAERDVSAFLVSLPAATPVARRIAEQSGVDLRSVQGTGPGERVTKADVARAIRAADTTAVPALIDTVPDRADQQATIAAMGLESVAETPVAGVRAVIAQRMHESHAVTAPVTLTVEVDATEFVALREQLKTRLWDVLKFNIGYNDLLVKLVAHALTEFPYMNAQLDQDAGVIRHLLQIHIALAVDTQRGLLVPVLRNVDRKGLAVIAREIRSLVDKARAGKALPDELSGSTFTITNLGMFEIDAFTPIINLPEAAILGVGRIKEQAAVVNSELCVRKLMWLSLTFDHRLVDGTPAARFLQYVKNLIEEPYLWLAARM